MAGSGRGNAKAMKDDTIAGTRRSRGSDGARQLARAQGCPWSMGIFPNPMRACARFVFVYFKKTLDHPSPALWPKASDQVVSLGPPWSDLCPLWPDAQQDEQLSQLN